MESAQTIANSTHDVKQGVKNAEAQASKKRGGRDLGITRDSRQTVQLVLDTRTIGFIQLMKNRGVFSQIYFDSCISSGKEASVYYAAVHATTCSSRVHVVSGNDHVEEAMQAMAPCEKCDPKANDIAVVAERAVKVFATSILKFKDRSQYMVGDARCERSYLGSNPRKKVCEWAQKEHRNLTRLVDHGIRAPMPLDLREHTLAMQFLGNGKDNAAPRLTNLKDMGTLTWSRIYVEVIVNLRAMYQEANLVHGDFSEYNILYHLGHPYIIDVSQSMDCGSTVEIEDGGTTIAQEMLERDCVNITKFFKDKLKSTSTRRGHVGLSAACSDDDSFSSDTSAPTASAPHLDDASYSAVRPLFTRDMEEPRILTPAQLVEYVRAGGGDARTLDKVWRKMDPPKAMFPRVIEENEKVKALEMMAIRDAGACEDIPSQPAYEGQIDVVTYDLAPMPEEFQVEERRKYPIIQQLKDLLMENPLDEYERPCTAWPQYDESDVAFDTEGQACEEKVPPSVKSDHTGNHEKMRYPLSHNEYRWIRKEFQYHCIAMTDYLLEQWDASDFPTPPDDEERQIELEVAEAHREDSDSDIEWGEAPGTPREDSDEDKFDGNIPEAPPMPEDSGLTQEEWEKRWWKKKVKEENKLKRQNKRPKKDKKRKERRGKK